MIIEKTWTELKALIATKKLRLQCCEQEKKYFLWAAENGDTYQGYIRKEETPTVGSDQEDFEDNYKSACNLPLHVVDDEGRHYLRAESKPTTMTTYFAGAGDTATEIGGGEKLVFDFNTTDNDIASPPTGYKQKQVCITFIDNVRLKEGTLYWENCPFGSYVDLCLGVPNGAWYLKNDGTPAQNTSGEQMAIAKFVKTTPMMGDCPMGDEMNTEAASNDIPAGTIFGFLVTVPDTVTTSDNCHGAIVMEVYRERTVILD